MEFFQSAVGVLQTLVIALGAGLGVWGVVNLLEWRSMSSGHRFSADRNEVKTMGTTIRARRARELSSSWPVSWNNNR